MNYTTKIRAKSEDIVICVLYVVLIFFDQISTYIPLASYLDEFIAMIAFLWMIIKKKKIGMHSIEFKIIMSCNAIVAIGLFSNLFFGYVVNISIITRDIVGTFKFILSFLAFDYIFIKKRFNVSKKLITTAKILITIIFVCGIISLFVNIGMGDMVRYGVRSYKFIFSYYNILVYTEVLLIATIMCDKKSNFVFYIMSFISILLTFRTKGIIVIILVFGFKMLELKKSNPIIYGGITKNLKYIIPIAIVTLLAVREKVAEYLSWGKYNSIRIGALVEGWNMLKDHFPLGTGFGTYGTNLSFYTDSVLYSIYDNINYKLMMDPQYGFATMSDTYWPSIYAQFGIIGFILFAYCLCLCFKKIRINRYIPDCNKQAGIFILLYLTVNSFSEATFTNSSGVVSAIMIAIISTMSGKVFRNSI